MALGDPEVWAAIVGYEGLYEVSSYGRVKTLPKTKTGKNKDGYLRRRVERIRCLCSGATGYLHVNLCKSGATKTHKIHLLVCEAFHGKKSSNQECRHKNGNQIDNYEWNLCWGTKRENVEDKIIHGSHRHERNSNVKLTKSQVLDIRGRDNDTNASLAREFGVSWTQISRIKSKQAWAGI